MSEYRIEQVKVGRRWDYYVVGPGEFCVEVEFLDHAEQLVERLNAQAAQIAKLEAATQLALTNGFHLLKRTQQQELTIGRVRAALEQAYEDAELAEARGYAHARNEEPAA